MYSLTVRDDNIPPSLPEVVIYTDGACDPNPGPGGWAAVILRTGHHPQELVGSESHTTNNRMELRAAIEALAALQCPHRVHLYTDSEYLRRGITEWLPNWERRGWKTSRRTPVKNQDLWRQLVQLMRHHQVHWHWVRGYADNRWNKYVDHLARAALSGKTK
jgi:ribonuclease HI